MHSGAFCIENTLTLSDVTVTVLVATGLVGLSCNGSCPVATGSVVRVQLQPDRSKLQQIRVQLQPDQSELQLVGVRLQLVRAQLQ
jgi:hypothetical protein